MKVAAIQMKVGEDKIENVINAGMYIKDMARLGVDLVVLPEMFCCPYQTELFPLYAEKEGGVVWQILSSLAKQYGIYLVAGSMPELGEENRIYNTSFIFDREGKQIGKHRKNHLFDINVTGGQYFKESDTLCAGEDLTLFETEFGTMGVCICFDIRFPEMFHEMTKQGAKMVFVPAAFNMTTGPAHWELLFRARALDGQIFVMGCAPARQETAGYQSFGHSILTDPWGRVVKQLEEKEGVLIEQIEWEVEHKVRQEIPLLRNKNNKMITSNLLN